MTAKIGDLTLATTAAADDLIEMERAADGLSRRISKVNFLGGTFTGGGSLATGGFTLTAPATGTAALKSGSPTTGRMAQWADANTIENSTLAKTGAGVLTLSAASAFTLTVPATGTAALLGTANVFTANQRINAQLGVGNTAISSAQAYIESTSSARSPLVIRAATSPSVPTAQIMDSAGSPGVYFYGSNAGGSNSGLPFNVLSVDRGSSAGPRIQVGRNNNSSTPAAGHWGMEDLSGLFYRMWTDASGNLRINTSDPTNANDTSGTVVGTQTSWIGLKKNIQAWNGADALQTLLETPLFEFELKADAGNTGRVYRGLVIENRDEWFAENTRENQTPALDERTLFGYLIAGIQALAARVAKLEGQIGKPID